ncbi:YfcL family protein [Thalassotalea litorea]|uniref:YfcL family protein n=1 Tax=Thalassotalea litorea TaxID=2020715 RepID=UPI0037350337
MLENIKTLEQLCDYFDGLIDQDDADVLFASSYVRGFILIASNRFGDDAQALTPELATQVSADLHQARSELTPQDKVVVENFWQQLQPCFC